MDAPTGQVRSRFGRLADLEQEGVRLQGALADDPTDQAALARFRTWQNACAVAVAELSGGSKAHWLARAYTEALLAPTPIEPIDASPALLVDRILNVLRRAQAGLATLLDNPDAGSASGPPATRRFNFVSNAGLRPSLEDAYLAAEAAQQKGDYPLALVTACSILEAVVTDALTQKDPKVLPQHGAPDGPVSTWPFQARIEVAERTRLISGGCARLPAIARIYRELLEPDGRLRPNVTVTLGEAKVARQVLNIIIRDLSGVGR